MTEAVLLNFSYYSKISDFDLCWNKQAHVIFFTKFQSVKNNTRRSSLQLILLSIVHVGSYRTFGSAGLSNRTEDVPRILIYLESIFQNGTILKDADVFCSNLCFVGEHPAVSVTPTTSIIGQVIFQIKFILYRSLHT